MSHTLRESRVAVIALCVLMALTLALPRPVLAAVKCTSPPAPKELVAALAALKKRQLRLQKVGEDWMKNARTSDWSEAELRAAIAENGSKTSLAIGGTALLAAGSLALIPAAGLSLFGGTITVQGMASFTATQKVLYSAISVGALFYTLDQWSSVPAATYPLPRTLSLDADMKGLLQMFIGPNADKNFHTALYSLAKSINEDAKKIEEELDAESSRIGRVQNKKLEELESERLKNIFGLNEQEDLETRRKFFFDIASSTLRTAQLLGALYDSSVAFCGSGRILKSGDLGQFLDGRAIGDLKIKFDDGTSLPIGEFLKGKSGKSGQ